MPNYNFDQAVAAAEHIGEGAKIHVVIATNQDNGIVSYMQGTLIYHKRAIVGKFNVPEHLSTAPSDPIQALFSDKLFGCPGELPDRPFSLADRAGFTISISLGFNNILATCSLLGHQYSFPLQRFGQLLIGAGAPIEHDTTNAVYTIAFTSVEAASSDVPK